MKRISSFLLFLVITAAVAALSVNASEKIEAYLIYYGENKAYCDDIRKDVPLNKGQKARESIFALTDRLTGFALSFHGEDAFSGTPSILSDIEKAKQHCRSTIETEIYFCNGCIRENNVKKEYIDKGYIVLRSDKTPNVIYDGKPYFAETDEERIKAENERLLEERTENIKRMSLDYSQLSDYVKGLENTEYAVFDASGNLLVANSDEVTAEKAKEYFKNKKDHIILWREGQDEHASFSDSFTFLSEGFVFPEAEEDYLLLISTDEGLGFDKSIKDAEGFYAETEEKLKGLTDEMIRSILLCVLPLAAALILTMLSSVSGNKKTVLWALGLCLAALVLSVVMTFFDSKTVIDILASTDPVKLSAGLSALSVKLFVPLMFLSAEGIIISTTFLIKSKR